MDETFLGELVVVGDAVEFEAGAEILFAALQRLDVLCVVLLKED